MTACKVDLDRLRVSLDTYLENELENLIVDHDGNEEADRLATQATRREASAEPKTRSKRR